MKELYFLVIKEGKYQGQNSSVDILFNGIKHYVEGDSKIISKYIKELIENEDVIIYGHGTALCWDIRDILNIDNIRVEYMDDKTIYHKENISSYDNYEEGKLRLWTFENN